MIYREFGKTKKNISVLGFGGMRFDRNIYRSENGVEKCAQLVAAAIDRGVNYFDTGHLYCNGLSEQIIGLGLSKRPKDRCYISTKSRIEFDSDSDAVLRRVESSLEVMGVDKIDFLQMWCILNLKHYRNVMKADGPYKGALRAKDRGLVEHICFSVHADCTEIETMINDDVFEGMTISFNAVNFEFRARAIELAYDKGLGIATMNPLGGGIITDKSKVFTKLRLNDSESVSEAALRFVAAHKEITVVLSGISNEQELINNTDSINRLDIVKDLQRVKKWINSGFSREYELCTGCDYCYGCPEHLQIFKIMTSYNHFLLSNRDKNVLFDQLFEVWKFPIQVFNCANCGACESKCTQHLQIIERVAEINDLISSLINTLRENIEHNICGKKDGLVLGVYGIGALARKFINDYKTVYGGIDVPLYMFDKDKSKIGTYPLREDVVVRSPSEIADTDITVLVVCNNLRYKEIYNDLKYLETKGIVITEYRDVVQEGDKGVNTK